MLEIQTPDAYEWTNVCNQYWATFAANFLMFGQGCIIGWLSPALAKLSSEDTPLVTGPLTTDQLSWIGSMSCIAGKDGHEQFVFVEIFCCCSCLGARHKTYDSAQMEKDDF